MRATSRHVKLGLLAIAVMVALGAAVFALGLREHPTVTYYTYFDESVQGLDEGAIVKYRGVRIGQVKIIRVAPDRKLVEVQLAIDRERSRALRLVDRALDLRARLVIFGITGVKMIDLDYADERTPPPPVLGFFPPGPYIPSRPSLLGALEEDLITIGHRMPVLIDRAIYTLEGIDRAAKDVRGFVRHSRSAVTAVGRVATATSRARVPVAMASALASVDELGRRTADASEELEHTLRDIGDAARALRDFLYTLEREPDMIVKGRARTR